MGAACSAWMEAHCDRGPRFVRVSAISAVLRLAFGIWVCAVETMPWGCWYGFFMVVGALLNAAALRDTLLQSRYYGHVLCSWALLDFGHFYSALLIASPYYTARKYVMRQPWLTPIAFVVIGFFLSFLTYWHKVYVCPLIDSASAGADSDNAINTAYDMSAMTMEEGVIGGAGDLSSPHPYGASARWSSKAERAYWMTVAPLAVFVFGTAESRLGSGVIPAPHSIEGIIGMITSFLMVAFYSRRYRKGACGILTSTIWSVLLTILLVVGFAMAAQKEPTLEKREQIDISLWSCIVFFACFITTFTLKFCLLREPYHLDFKRPTQVVEKRGMSAVIISPSMRPPMAHSEVEARAYGMSRAEAEATAKKLGLASTDGVHAADSGNAASPFPSAVARGLERDETKTSMRF